MASSEYQGWPPRVVRGSASHAAMASSVNQTVKLPRWRRLASEAGQFVTLRCWRGMWGRRSWFSLRARWASMIRRGPLPYAIPPHSTNQPIRAPQPLTPPVVGAATRLQSHRAGRERGEERQKLAAAQLLAKDHRARAVGSVQLKDVLGEIQSDGAHRVHGRLLEWPATPSLWHTTAAGGVHTIRTQKRAGIHALS